jgi:hypothetical protein
MCADKLKTAFDSLDPERLEIDALIEDTTSVLNDWLIHCVTLPELSAKDQKFYQNFLGQEELAFLQAQQFVSRDIGQIRTNILLRQIGETATRGGGTELERVVRLFEYVTRNVIRTPDNQKLPLTLYEVLIFGRGTAEHQAWAFAELLHQLKIDSAILTAKSREPSDEWVFCVCLDQGNYLFDFSLLTPVPSGEETEGWPITQPATLEEVIDNPGLIAALREHGSQVPSAEALKSPQVWIPSESTYWSPRMQELSATRSGKPYLVADSLLDGAGEQRGILSRIDEAGKRWNRSDIKLWPFPTQQQRGYWSINPKSSQGQILRARKMPFYAPMRFSVNEQTGKISIQEHSNKQWQSRLAQLSGKYQTAIPTYGSLRLGSSGTKSILQGQDDFPQLQDFLRREDAAAEDAHFWVGVCQLELGRYSDAGVTLRDYLNKYPNSNWTDAVHMLLATIELKKDDSAGAVEQLSQVPNNSLLRPAAVYIRLRIAPAGEQASSAEADETENNQSSSTE